MPSLGPRTSHRPLYSYKHRFSRLECLAERGEPVPTASPLLVDMTSVCQWTRRLQPQPRAGPVRFGLYMCNLKTLKASFGLLDAGTQRQRQTANACESLSCGEGEIGQPVDLSRYLPFPDAPCRWAKGHSPRSASTNTVPRSLG